MPTMPMERPSLMTLVMPCLRALRATRLALFSSSSWSPSASLFCHVPRGSSILQAVLLLSLGLGWANPGHVRQPVVSENQQKHRAKLVLSPPAWIAFVSTVTWSSDDQLSSTTALSTSISFRCLYRALCALDHTSIVSYTLIYHHLCISHPLSSAPISSTRFSFHIPFHPRVSSPHHLSLYMYVYKGRSLRRPVTKICVVSSLCFILSFLYLLPLVRYPSLPPPLVCLSIAPFLQGPDTAPVFRVPSHFVVFRLPSLRVALHPSFASLPQSEAADGAPPPRSSLDSLSVVCLVSSHFSFHGHSYFQSQSHPLSPSKSNIQQNSPHLSPFAPSFLPQTFAYCTIEYISICRMPW
ncbi:hypothetical protein C8Q74DRAFT_27135 [Fomes fomentarius]|nr:hypothetical protein C8Q74DRAFT_27135 [Fomes fomentarius]